MADKNGRDDFWEKSPIHSPDTLQVKNFVEIALSLTVITINAFYAEIQDGRQKWWENDFWEKSPVDSVDNVGKKFCENGSISHRYGDKCFFAFYAEIQDSCQKWR